MLAETIRSIWNTLRHEGLFSTFALCSARLTDVRFDQRYGTDTYGWVGPSDFGLGAEHVAHSEFYKPSHAASLREVLQSLDVVAPKVLLDIGCGKGRALLVAAELGFDSARGIEFSPVLAKIAQQNIELFCGRQQPKTKFSVIVDDVRNCSLRDDENILYLFNPFDGTVMASVLEIVETSLAKRPRKVFVVYRAPQQRHFFDTSAFFQRPRWFHSWGQAYLVFESRFG